MVNPSDLMERGLEAEMVGLLAVGLVVSLTAGLAVTGDSTDAPTAPAQTDVPQWEGVYTVKILRDTDGDGDREVVFEDREENTLADQGQNWIRSQIAKVSSSDHIAKETTNATYIAVGNGTTVQAGDTVLDNEIQCCGLSRAAGSVTSFAAGEFSVKNQFTASLSSGSVVVNTTSLNWDSAAGSTTLVSGGSFSDANLLDGDKLTVTHNVTIS